MPALGQRHCVSVKVNISLLGILAQEVEYVSQFFYVS